MTQLLVDRPQGDLDAPAARRELLRWYRRHKRDLPWRRTNDPYAIWISEVMLQQTTVKTVMPYYERFLSQFPTVEALAAASEDDVLALWSGLGYYHRARNLLRGARHVVANHRSTFPRDKAAALAVPGVGLYTANAVRSIAFDEPVAVLDGNVKRVLARFHAVRGAATGKDATYHNLAADLLDRGAPGDWNQAVMELGATICTPRSPACAACPWCERCRARSLGLQESLPVGASRRPPVDVTVAAALVRHGRTFLFARRPGGRLMGGMWELPQTSLESNGRTDLVREAEARYGLSLRLGSLCATGRHAITFRRIQLEGYAATLEKPARLGEGESLRWIEPEDLGSVGTSSISRKLLRSALGPQVPLPLV